MPGEAFEDWLREQRLLWERRVLEALDQAARADEAAAAWGDLAARARRALEIDPLQERFHRRLMLALYQAGDRAAALSQFDTCRRLLERELDTEPSLETRELRDALAAGTLPRRTPASARPGGEKPPAPSTAGVLIRRPGLPLIGREGELARIEDALARAAAGDGPAAVLLHGEAGIGKTRLVEEALWQGGSRRNGAFRSLLLGQSYEKTRDLPYAPFVAALTRLADALDVGALGLPADLLAEVGCLVPGLGPPNAAPAPTAGDAAAERLHLFEGVARFLSALPAPVLLVLEDLHWADEASRDLLAHLVRRPSPRGLAVLATGRAEETPEDLEVLLRGLEREERLVRIEVGALPVDAIQGLVKLLAPREDARLGERLHAETRGNPLFAVEILRPLKETGQLNDPSRPIDRLPIPATLQAVVAGRLAQMPAPARELLAAAAVFPDPVPFHRLGAVARLSEDAALAALERTLPPGSAKNTKSGVHSTISARRPRSSSALRRAVTSREIPIR